MSESDIFKDNPKDMIQNELIIDERELYFLVDEVEKYKDIYCSLKKILLIINPNLLLNEILEVDISTKTKNILTILPRSFPKEFNINHILIITDMDNVWSRIKFFEDYFEQSKEYKFSIDLFRKMLFSRGAYEEMIGRNKILSFLPFIISRGYFGLIPSLIFKDASFYKKFQSFKYCNNYQKSKIFNNKVNKVIERLNDGQSKNIYDITLNGKAEDNWEWYFNNAHKNLQYSDYIKINEQDVIINCGIEGGFEIPLFSLNNPGTIYNIDPCGDSLLSNIVNDSIKNTSVNNVFIEKALYMTDGVPEEFKQFETTTLLEVIDDYNIDKINLIKSDIEGGERYMVDDLIEISEKFRPQLAISIYHTSKKMPLNDYVDIPLKLMNSLTNYKFYINHYSYERWELVLYCIPNNIE